MAIMGFWKKFTPFLTASCASHLRGHVAAAVDADPPLLAQDGRAELADRAVGEVGE